MHLPAGNLSQPSAGPDEGPAPEFFGEEDPVPLAAVWPGLWPVLKEWKLDVPDRPRDLVRCDRILVGGKEYDRILHNSNIYLRRLGDGRLELRTVLNVLSAPRLFRLLKVVDERVQAKKSMEQRKTEVARWTAGLLSSISKSILEYKPPPTAAAVRQQSTDAERLLKAVGASNLRELLPESLLTILDSGSTPLTGIGVAEAAIATYDTGALNAYRRYLQHLDPPRRWAARATRSISFDRWDFLRSGQESAMCAARHSSRSRTVHTSPAARVPGIDRQQVAEHAWRREPRDRSAH